MFASPLHTEGRRTQALQRTRWLRSLWCGLFAVVATQAAAQASRCDGVDTRGGTGGAHFNNNLPYEQDVFSFCRIGYPAHCWVSVAPSAGTWTWIPNCSPRNAQWIPAFTQTCPHSSSEGTWTGPPGPLDHKGDPNGSGGLSACEHHR